MSLLGLLARARHCRSYGIPHFSSSIFRSFLLPRTSAVLKQRLRFCSSKPEPSPENPPDGSTRRRERVSIQPVSYAVKSEDPPKANEEIAENPDEPPAEPPLRQGQRQSNFGPSDFGSRSWTREDVRYVKNVPAISPISYPAKVAPLPEDRAAPSLGDGAPRDEGMHVSVQLDLEAGNTQASSRVIRQQTEQEKVPFPTLLKFEKKESKKAIYDLREAIRQVKIGSPKRKFTETVEAHVRLGVNMRRTDMMVRGTTTLPHGTGKVIKVAVFADGDLAEEARAAGADIIGGDALIDQIKTSGVPPQVDLCIATELYMSRLRKVAMVLRNLMPNPRKGSVTDEVGRSVREAKRGFIEFKMDKTAIVHVRLGTVDFPEDSLHENAGAFLNALLQAKPAGLKKTSRFAGYVKSFHLCSTMGRSFPVSIQSISTAADHFSRLRLR